MTYQYDDIDPEDALYNAVRMYPGKIPALALRLGQSAKTLEKKLSPAVATHVNGYGEALQQIKLLDEVVPEAADLAIDAFNWHFNRISIKLPEATDVSADSLLQQVVDVFQREGELAKEINEALRSDHHIDDGELARIEKRIQVATEALVQLREEVRTKHQADKAGK